VMLASRAEVLALKPNYSALLGLQIGVVAPWDAAVDIAEAQFELRAFVPSRAAEDPVTGSLNAGVAQWLIAAGLAPKSYVASQGTALGRIGRIYVEQADGETWIGGNTVTCIKGQVAI
jgi:predicted PhzF superfamily epimerase YddE/YHI9